jgi:putative ABC transport system permease protein
MPAFRRLVGKPWLDIPFTKQPMLIIPLISLSLLIGLIAGIYPSLFLSSFKPAATLSGAVSRGMKRSTLRNILVGFQFSLSILLLVATLVVQKQMNFIQNRNLGYDNEQVVVVPTYGELGQNHSVLRETLLRRPLVTAVSASSSVPGTTFTNVGMGLETAGSNHGQNLFITDPGFLETMKLKMAKGRFFSYNIPTDRQAVIINEAYARALRNDDLMGQRMRIWVGGGEMPLFHIIGIVRDFFYESFHEPVKPLAIVMLNGVCSWSESFVSIRIKTKDIRDTVDEIHRSWEKVLSDIPFNYSFLDTIYDDQYKNEERTGSVFTIFTLFAIFVACLGLLGLASFAVEQRTKEIGIRKILGAPVPRIVAMLLKDFTRWVAFSNLIAWPLAYYFMSQWLKNFAYRTEIGFWPFVLSGLLMLAVTGITVSYHTLKSATALPADALRYE